MNISLFFQLLFEFIPILKEITVSPGRIAPVVSIRLLDDERLWPEGPVADRLFARHRPHVGHVDAHCCGEALFFKYNNNN
jgi:hypothetical protein